MGIPWILFISMPKWDPLEEVDGQRADGFISCRKALCVAVELRKRAVRERAFVGNRSDNWSTRSKDGATQWARAGRCRECGLQPDSITDNERTLAFRFCRLVAPPMMSAARGSNTVMAASGGRIWTNRH